MLASRSELGARPSARPPRRRSSGSAARPPTPYPAGRARTPDRPSHRGRTAARPCERRARRPAVEREAVRDHRVAAVRDAQRRSWSSRKTDQQAPRRSSSSRSSAASTAAAGSPSASTSLAIAPATTDACSVEKSDCPSRYLLAPAARQSAASAGSLRHRPDGRDGERGGEAGRAGGGSDVRRLRGTPPALRLSLRGETPDRRAVGREGQRARLPDAVSSMMHHQASRYQASRATSRCSTANPRRAAVTSSRLPKAV